MPARRNRPGRSGTTPLPELHRQQEETVLAAIKAHELRHPNTVYWAKDAEMPACLRLADRGVIVAPNAPSAFWLTPSSPFAPF